MLADGSRPGWAALGTALLLTAAGTLLAALPAWRAEPLRFAGAYALVFSIYAAALAFWHGVSGRRWTLLIITTGALLRLLVWWIHPEDLSHDVARYAWDGHLSAQGVNPFAHAPADEALLPHRTPFFGDISYKEIPTIYPPLAQGLFLLAALLQPGTAMVRLLLTLCDIGILVLLARLLVQRGLPAGRLIVYAWCPLPVVEVASSGHVEPLGMLALLAAALALGRGMRATSGVAWAGAVLTKLGPILLAPSFLRRAGTRGAAAAGISVGLLYLPFIGAPHLLTAVAEYSQRWRFNDFLFAFIAALSESLGSAPDVPRLVAGAMLTGWVLYVALNPDRDADAGTGFLRDAARIIGAAVLLSPTLHPWYLLWLLPLLAFRMSPPWILLCALVPLSYVPALQDSRLLGPSAGTWLQYAPCILLAVRVRWRGGQAHDKKRASEALP